MPCLFRCVLDWCEFEFRLTDSHLTPFLWIVYQQGKEKGYDWQYEDRLDGHGDTPGVRNRPKQGYADAPGANGETDHHS